MRDPCTTDTGKKNELLLCVCVFELLLSPVYILHHFKVEFRKLASK